VSQGSSRVSDGRIWTAVAAALVLIVLERSKLLTRPHAPITSTHCPPHHRHSKHPSVCDLYAEWAGPCKAVRETFKKLHMEHGEGSGGGLPLRFVTVNVDRVPALEQYKARGCQPLFLFYRDGRVVNKVEGVEIPKISALAVALARKQH